LTTNPEIAGSFQAIALQKEKMVQKKKKWLFDKTFQRRI
jgi:hypothetical protein